MTLPWIVADSFEPHFDELSMNLLILHKAYEFRLRNIEAFWLLLGSHYRWMDLELLASNKWDERYPGVTPLVFRTGDPYTYNTRWFEFHSNHGGFYRLNVQDVLQGHCLGRLLGESCQTMEDTLTEPLPYSCAVELRHKAEFDRNLPLLKLARERATIFSKIGFSPKVSTNDLGVKGAHEEAFAENRCDLFVVDSDFRPSEDTILLKREFGFKTNGGGDAKYTHLWYSRNPVNGLEYGHGGVKLFPREAQTKRRESTLQGDFTLSVGEGVVIHPIVLGTHQFNWSSFSTWITAAKECAKLSLISKEDKEAEARLRVWVNNVDLTAMFWHECRAGALFGSSNPQQILGRTHAEHRALYAQAYTGVQ